MVTKIELLFVFACIAFTSGTGEDVGGPPEPFPPNSTSTTLAPTTTINVTTTPASPTTTASNTTTASTTTTANTTTTDTTPITSTYVPTTSATTLPTTAMPDLKPVIGKWNVTSGNVTYILAEMAVQLNITYDEGVNVTHHAIFNIPKDANATGICGNDTQSLNIMWLNKDNTTANQFTIFFEKNSTENRYMIRNISINVTLTKEEFPYINDTTTIMLYNNKTEFSTPLHKSYRCAKEQTFDLMKSESNETFGTITLSQVQLEAFHEKMDTLFDTAEDCEKSSSPDIVPIAVGCALVALVAIVLIAYLVGRRRSQTRGYLSM